MTDMIFTGNKKLWFYVTIFTLFTVAVTEALKCRIADEKIQQDFNDVVRTCMSTIGGNSRNNNNSTNTGNGRNDNRYPSNQRGQTYTTTRRPYMRGNSPQNNKKDGYDEEEEYDSDEGTSFTRNSGRMPNRFNNRNNNGFRSPFEQDNGRRSNRTGSSNGNPYSNKPAGSSPLEDIDPCTVHCVFRQMKMLDNDAKPDKSSIVTVMTQKIRNPELKDFIHESIMDCFEIIESGLQVDAKCEFSKQFALCLEEKGQQNCEDWDEDDKKNNKNNNNKQQGMNRNNQNGRPNPFRG